ncbi:MAG: YicC family protein [Bradymonadales bacterium]|nr:YicC family protein [Bradymonadales bacterium]
MALRSMTGYGAAQGARDGWQLTVECRSVNHRSLDIHITAPTSLWACEMTVRELVKRHCRRGRIDCRLALDSTGPIQLAPPALSQVRQLYDLLDTIRDHLRLGRPVTLRDMLTAGLSPVGLNTVSLQPDEVEQLVTSVTGEALARLVAAREREGQALCQELANRVERTRALLEQIEPKSIVERESQAKRVKQRIETLLGELEVKQAIENDRLYQEMAFTLERSDITEELVRSQSHVEALRKQIAGSLTPMSTAGKGIDFLLQELSRELNTMAAKSSSADLTADILEMKVEVERMREQVQNIE